MIIEYKCDKDNNREPILVVWCLGVKIIGSGCLFNTDVGANRRGLALI